MNDDDDRARYQALVRSFDEPSMRVRIRRKDESAMQSFIGHALRALTFGGQDRYMSEYVTTLGRTIWVPADWERWTHRARYKVLRHEVVHVRQFERLGWIGMVLVYGCFPLPAGLAWGRAELEWEAYAETLRAEFDLEGLSGASDRRLHDGIVRRFTGPDYGWMWPFEGWVRRRIERELSRFSRGRPEP